MILPDVNLLVYAFREEVTQHERAADWLNALVRDRAALLLPDPVTTGFLRIVTNRAIFERPSETSLALEFVERLTAPRSSRVVGESARAWTVMRDFVDADSKIRARLVPDAYLAALAIASGAKLATNDSGFDRYPNLRWFRPLA